jgi:hypothetical protein
MKFILLDKTNKSVVVAASTHYDVKKFAERLFAMRYPPGAKVTPPFDVIETADGAREDFQLEWRGTDAGAHPNRNLWVRSAGGVEWERIDR